MTDLAPLTQLAYDTGRYARMLEDYNRDAEKLLIEMGLRPSKVKDEVSGNGNNEMRGLHGNVCPVVRSSVEAEIHQDGRGDDDGRAALSEMP